MAEHESETGSAPKPRGPVDVALSNPVAVVSLVGGLVYVATRLGYVAFYDGFGLDPEDVGIGYAETLTRAAAAVIPLTVLAIFLLAILGHLVGERVRTRIGRFVRTNRAGSGALLITSILVVFLYAVIGLPVQYGNAAQSVQNGDTPVVDPRRIGPQFTNPLGVRADRVRVEWIANDEAPHDIGDGQEFIYLGRAGGLTALYDLEHQRTIRVPDASIALEILDD